MAFSEGAKRKRNRHTAWSPIDLLMAVAIVLFGLYWLMLREDTDPAAREVLIYRDDTVIATIPLAEDRRIDLTPHGAAMVVEVRDGQVRVRSSDCHQQVCVRKGWTGQVHDPIICIPNRVTIEVTGRDARYDAISR
jgi:hypothetical protein